MWAGKKDVIATHSKWPGSQEGLQIPQWLLTALLEASAEAWFLKSSQGVCELHWALNSISFPPQGSERASPGPMPDWQEWLIPGAELSSAWGVHLPLQLGQCLPPSLPPMPCPWRSSLRIRKAMLEAFQGHLPPWVVMVSCFFVSRPLYFYVMF